MARSLIPWRRHEDEQEHPFMSLRWEMDRLFEDFGHFWPGRWFGEREWMPPVDVEETDKEVVVNAELPGVEAKDLDISIREDTLTLKGERQEEKEDKSKTYHRVERRYGSFERSIPLPCSVDADKADATYKDGMLRITLPKKPEERGKSVKVKVE